MSGLDWREQAFAAHQRADAAGARAALSQGGEQILGDSQGMQLLALVSEHGADEASLFAYAALEMEPADANAVFNLGVVDQRLGNNAKALLRYEWALRLDPGHLGSLNNVSDLLRRHRRPREAWAAIQRYLELGGSPVGLEIRLAKIADDLGLSADAHRWYERARLHDPDSAFVQFEQALCQLRDEQFDAGWWNYEARRRHFDHDPLALVSYAMPEWDGRALGGRSLLVHKEQGLGDTIMFASCLPDLVESGVTLHLAVQPQLSRLFATSFPTARIWPSSSTSEFCDEAHQPWRRWAGPIDFQSPFGSLPLHLRSAGFPQPRTYMRASPEDRMAWRRRLRQLDPSADAMLRVGLAISARRDGFRGPGVADGIPRSINPVLAAALACDGVAWFGLHDMAGAGEFANIPGLSVIDTSDWLYDLADTAALIGELDVVVTVDTVIAHLAGAMGKKVLLLLPRQADWRWGRSRTTSYWYPDVEIFRQEAEGDWRAPLHHVRERLAGLVQDRGRGGGS